MKKYLIAVIMCVAFATIASAECPCKKAAVEKAACPCEMKDGVCACQK